MSKNKENVGTERCGICNCNLHRSGDYAKPSTKGRSHRTKHHYVAERFYGRSLNRKGTKRKPIFYQDPWSLNTKTGVFCYECHEELLHNPVLLPEDIGRFRELVIARRLDESHKTKSRELIAGRIKLFHSVIEVGLNHLLNCERVFPPVKTVDNKLDIEAYRSQIEEICRARRVHSLEIFGSAAAGTFDVQRSDIDFLATFLELGPGEHADAYFGLIEDLEKLFGRKVDLVSPDCIKNPFLLKSVNESRKLVYKVDAA